MAAVEAYGPAMAALALMVLMTLALNAATGFQKGKRGLPAGGAPDADYADPLYRLNRNYINTAETVPLVGVTVFLAVAAGVGAVWVNLFAWGVLLLRAGYTLVHLRGIGAEANGLRSILFIGAWALTLLLALFAGIAAL